MQRAKGGHQGGRGEWRANQGSACDDKGQQLAVGPSFCDSIVFQVLILPSLRIRVFGNLGSQLLFVVQVGLWKKCFVCEVKRMW